VKSKVLTRKIEWNGRKHTLEIDIPPLSVTVYRLLSSVEDKPKATKTKVAITKKVETKVKGKKR
jgi:hypothetical protein